MGHYFFCFGLLLHLAMPGGAGQGKLEGLVVDSLTNRPIRGASLLLSRTDGMKYASQQTDSAGKFSFAELPDGTYDLFISAKGHKVLRMKHIEVSGTEPKRLTIRLAEGNAPYHELGGPRYTMPLLKPDTSTDYRMQRIPVDTTVRYR